MADVKSYETPIMALDEFEIGLLEKDRVPGLLIRSDHNGYYNIGIQINDKEVVVVGTTMEDQAFEKMQYWEERIEKIKKQYQREAKLKPFKGQ